MPRRQAGGQSLGACPHAPRMGHCCPALRHARTASPQLPLPHCTALQAHQKTEQTLSRDLRRRQFLPTACMPRRQAGRQGPGACPHAPRMGHCCPALRHARTASPQLPLPHCTALQAHQKTEQTLSRDLRRRQFLPTTCMPHRQAGGQADGAPAHARTRKGWLWQAARSGDAGGLSACTRPQGWGKGAAQAASSRRRAAWARVPGVAAACSRL